MQPRKILLAGVAGVVVAGTVLPAGAATLSGRVRFEGTPPKAKRLKMDADPKCHEMHAEEPARDESVIVNDNGTLRNVFVYVKSGLTKTYEPPKEPVVLDQKGCLYHPRVFGVQARQPLRIRNSDDTLHNVHATPKLNKEFNLAQPAGTPEVTRAFPNPEVMIPFKCDVHPWMAAYAGVVNHPFYAVTGADGAFVLKDLPAGEYEIEAWHEKYGTQTQKVTLAEDESKEISFSFKPSE